TVDVIAALLIAAFIAYAGIQVLRSNLGYLSDTAQLDPGGIDRVARDVEGVTSTHKIRTRGSPGRIYVDLHIQVTRTLGVVEAHPHPHAREPRPHLRRSPHPSHSHARRRRSAPRHARRHRRHQAEVPRRARRLDPHRARRREPRTRSVIVRALTLAPGSAQ